MRLQTWRPSLLLQPGGVPRPTAPAPSTACMRLQTVVRTFGAAASATCASAASRCASAASRRASSASRAERSPPPEGPPPPRAELATLKMEATPEALGGAAAAGAGAAGAAGAVGVLEPGPAPHAPYV
jgi:hypothetical protein